MFHTGLRQRKRNAVVALVRQLGSRNPARRQEAEEALRALAPEDLQQLVSITRALPSRTTHPVLLWVFLLSPLAVVTADLFHVWTGPDYQTRNIVSGLVFYMGLFAFAVLPFRFLLKPRFEGSVTRALVVNGQPPVFGPLLMYVVLGVSDAPAILDAFPRFRSWRQRRSAAVADALVTLSPQVRPGEDADLTFSDRYYLREALTQADAPLAVALLELLGRIGDGDDLSVVRWLARGEAAAQHDAEVREAAGRCAEAIEARLADEKAACTLLRPSSAADQPETLLRAAAASTPLEQEQLLRASDSDSANSG